jgi:flagellar motility protein MotE (MotC chaperone)
MKKHAFTALLVLLGLGLGVGTSLAVFWSASSRFVASAATARAADVTAKLPAKPWDFWTIEMENLANDLRDERTRVKQHEDQLAQREARLTAEQQELEKTRKQIEELRAAIDERLIEVTEGEAANLKKLALTYGALTPKSAVAIFREMDDTTLVKLFSLMRPETVGPILEEMGKQSASDANIAKRAALLTERLRMIKNAKKPATEP